jgi:hypothetical protein
VRTPAALLLTLLALPAHGAVYRVGPAFFPGCTHSSLAAALTEAAGNPDAANVIRLANNMAHTGARIALADAKALSIEGGFDNCVDSTSNPNTPTVLDALPGDSLVRVDLTGGAGLSLVSVVIQGGDATSGGGIQILSGTVALDNVQVRDNQAIVGGGVSVTGGGALPSVLRIGVNARPSFIFQNMTRPGSSGLGGGVYCNGGGTISFVSGGVTDNLAMSGGGLYVEDGCRLQFDGQQPASPPVIRNNVAALDGGAIFAALAQVTTSDNTRIFVDGNQARNGAALFADDGANVALRYAWIKANVATGVNGSVVAASGADSVIALRGGPAHVRCEGGEFCSQVHGAGTPKGAIESSAGARVEIDRVHLTGFDSTFASVFARSATIRIATSLISGNRNTAGLVQAFDGARVDVDYSTLVDNTVPAVFINANGTAPQGQVFLHASVVFNAAPLAPATNFLQFTDGACRSLVNENLNADGVGTIGATSGLDADFVPLFDRGLAIDACPTEPQYALDLLGNPRPFDAPISNFGGPMDRGAFERQSEPPLFRDGFE